MKKYVCLLLSGLLLTAPLTMKVKANAMNEQLFTASLAINDHREEGNLIINGNYSSFDYDELKEITSDPEKICIFYDVNLADNTNDTYNVTTNNAVVYYYQNGVPFMHSYKSNSDDVVTLKRNIETFVNEKISLAAVSIATYNTRSVDTSIFTDLYSGSFRTEEAPYGYIDCDYVVKKYQANTVSSLYIIESHMYFTPGAVAKANGSSAYSSTWKNKSGYMHLGASQAMAEVGYDYRYGGTPVFKDAYPVNQPGTLSISSTYSAGINLGYSFTNGFNLDGLYVEGSDTIGANIAYSYSKTYTNQEPALSAQKNADDPQIFEWSYTYNTERSETNHLFTGYMFEMNNSGHNLREGDVAFRYDYRMKVHNGDWWIFAKTHNITGFQILNYY